MPYNGQCCSILHIINNLEAGLLLPLNSLPWWSHSMPSRPSNTDIFNSQVKKKLCSHVRLCII